MNGCTVYVDGQALASSVSRLLGKRFTRSTTSATAVRGFRNRQGGFTVTAADRPDDHDHVHARVSYATDGSRYRRDNEGRLAAVAANVALLHRYVTEHAPAGWTVGPVAPDRWGDAEFTVTAPQGYR